MAMMGLGLGRMVVGGMRFWPVVAKVWRKHGLNWTVAGLSASQIYDVVKATAPESDEGDLREVSNQLARMTDEDEVLQPKDDHGQPLYTKYLTINMEQGNAWFHTKYYSGKSMAAARRSGGARGGRRAERQISRRTNIYRGT